MRLRAGLFAEPTNRHPLLEKLPAFVAGGKGSKPKELAPPGVIAFEHSVDLHSVQAGNRNRTRLRAFYGIFISFRRLYKERSR